MKIAVIGAGQMGGYYVNNMVTKCGVPARDIFVIDRVPTKAAALADKFGVVACAEVPQDINAAIVVTNTPSHHEVVARLAQQGVQHILCEKPLAQTQEGVAHIRKYMGEAKIYTALVINFSPALTRVLAEMVSRKLTLIDAYGRWGKNRGAASEKRPTAGDLEDEAVHPLAFILALLGSGYSKAAVSAQVGWLPYVNHDAQQVARARDSSFPERPNHSTSANIQFGGEGHSVLANIYSSFLHPHETRLVGGLLGVKDDAKLAFEVNFDQKRPDKTGGAVDILKMVDVSKNEAELHEFPSDKLNDLTQAFLNAACGRRFDPRLVTIDQAGSLVDLTTAMLSSDSVCGVPRIVSLIQ